MAQARDRNLRTQPAPRALLIAVPPADRIFSGKSQDDRKHPVTWRLLPRRQSSAEATGIWTSSTVFRLAAMQRFLCADAQQWLSG